MSSPFSTEFIFHKSQVIDVQIWNTKDDFLGYTRFEIGSLVGSKNNSLELEVFGGILGLDKMAYDKKIAQEDLK